MKEYGCFRTNKAVERRKKNPLLVVVRMRELKSDQPHRSPNCVASNAITEVKSNQDESIHQIRKSIRSIDLVSHCADSDLNLSITAFPLNLPRGEADGSALVVTART